MSEHTKTPWHLDKYGHLFDSELQEVMTRGMTTLASGSPASIAEAKANTEFIVRACNSHYDLLALYERCRDCYGDLPHSIQLLVDAAHSILIKPEASHG